MKALKANICIALEHQMYPAKTSGFLFWPYRWFSIDKHSFPPNGTMTPQDLGKMLSQMGNKNMDGTCPINPAQMQDMLNKAISSQSTDGPAMGMMAFGYGVNEKGKKVARAGKVSYNAHTGIAEKDFIEKQIEEDDPVIAENQCTKTEDIEVEAITIEGKDK